MARPKTLCLRLVRALSFIIVLLTIPVGEQPRTVAHVSGPALQAAEAVEPKVMVFPITAGHNDQYPTVYGRLVVWVEAGKASSSQGPIVAYDLMAKRRVEVTGAPTATTPAVWGNTVVWVDGPSQALSILGYDIASGRRFTIAEGLLAPPDRLAISGNTVVWTDWREGDVRRRTGSHVYAYDVVTREERRISPPETGQGYPAISGDTVVWMDFGKGVTDTDIYGYNLREKRLFSISTAPGQQQFPAVSGNTVVWRDVDGLRAYELDSAREYLITPRRPEHFAIDGSLVAYAAWDGLDKLYSLYGYDLERKMEFPIRRGVRKIFRYPGVSGNLIVWLESPPDPKVWTEADIYGAWILIGADYGVPTGHFYTQASGQPPESGLGFSVTNDGDIPFWDQFPRLGGVPALGYPVSQRFTYKGFVTQAFQKAVMQWQPGESQESGVDGQVLLLNVFDELHQAGKDDWLLAVRATPRQLDPSFDAGKSWEEIVRDRLALLEANPAIKERYFSAEDPLLLYGLPTSRVEDMGNHFAIRLQRAVIQQWKEDVPWARAGEVTVANGGDIAKKSGLMPVEALLPQGPPG